MTPHVDIHLDIGETEQYEVVSCHLEETIADGVVALVRIAAAEDIEFDRALLGPARLKLVFGADHRATVFPRTKGLGLISE